ncbi:helix-turn-helix domain-containing protein [Mesorhizobium sp. NPDC059025]|uniref:helix-turn-helix transcriptional regulator n=1 Tax=unclassified Mesorhizobium TaxID=325217 RepID=UPI0036798B91
MQASSGSSLSPPFDAHIAKLDYAALAPHVSGKFLKSAGNHLFVKMGGNILNEHAALRLQHQRPSVFRQPDSFMYADNCRELQAAAQRGEVELHAWTRGSYPGTSLGERLPGVRTVGFWDARNKQAWGLGTHCNEGFKIAYLARGNLNLVVDDCAYELEQGQFIVIRPWQLHSIGNPVVDASKLLWVILDAGLRRPSEPCHWPNWLVFSRDEADALDRLLTQNNQPVWDAGSDLRRTFEALAPILLERMPKDGETRLKVALNAIMISLIERMSEQAPKLDPNLSTSQHTVAIFLRRLGLALGEAWTLETMAEECGLSRTRFSEHCKQLTNMTPWHYLQHLRLEEASRLLANSNRQSVTEIAFSCGFNSSQYFSNAYRRRYGCAPTISRRGSTVQIGTPS